MSRTVQGDFFADMLSRMERRNPFGGHFVSPRRFTLDDHVLYVAELDPRFMGGSIAGGTLSRQIFEPPYSTMTRLIAALHPAIVDSASALHVSFGSGAT